MNTTLTTIAAATAAAPVAKLSADRIDERLQRRRDARVAAAAQAGWLAALR
ncbi:MAG: hypothetical protein J7513_13440 [Solirubrobacteraceae bacterium]|nr:hypothetical protein [Solirubrobacteraceae bacterium]